MRRQPKLLQVLSDIKIYNKAREKVDDYMLKARHASTINETKEWEKMAKAVAKEYQLPIPELCFTETYPKVHEEINY